MHPKEPLIKLAGFLRAAMAQSQKLPLTTIAVVFVGSCYKGLYRNYRGT